MPLYEYKCKDCGCEFEALVLGAEDPVCPSCKSEKLEKVFSAFSMSQGGTGSRGLSYSTSGGNCPPSGGGG